MILFVCNECFYSLFFLFTCRCYCLFLLMDPGPLDTSILHSQSTHRSSLIFTGQDLGELRCRRREAILHRTIALDDRIIPLLLQAGFYGVARLGFISLDWHLITIFVERWRPETHTFHLPQGECTITLQDIAVLVGLPIDGDAIIGHTHMDWRRICHDLLGVTLGDRDIDGQRLHLNWLLDKFSTLPPDADEESIRCYCRAYILQLIGGCHFADKSNSKVHLMFFPFLKDFDTAGTYSWGSACLAWLYRELCRASHIDARDISSPLIILQPWIWDRFPFIAPQRLYSVPRDRRLPQPPLGTRYI